MKTKSPILSAGPALLASVFLGACVIAGATNASATVKYLADGALQNNAGGWDLPQQGTCSPDAGQPSRPECLALRIVAASSGACTTAGGSWSTGVCNDSLATDQAACEAKPDRLWNSATNVCAIVMMDEDRNDVVCMVNNGTWVSAGTCTGNWVMPNGNAYTPNILTAAPTAAAGAGDQCLRCHNGRTQYNGNRVRDVEDTLNMGHKNMSRKVTVGKPWGGPPFECTGAPAETNQLDCFRAGGTWDPTIYPTTDVGQPFDWVNGTVDIGTALSPNPRSLYWIYADWLSPNPRAVYSDVPDTAATPDKPKVSYSCARCHTTGWTADAVLRTDKEPELSFPGITWNGVSDAVTGQVNLAPGTPYTEKMASWDQFGILCSRCHNSAIDTDIKRCYGVTQAACVAPSVWDSRGSQCFSTQADCTTMGGTSWDMPYGAPLGMSTHHNDLTTADVGSSGTGGYCTDQRFTAQTQCDNAGGAWLTACSVAGVCSNPAYTTSGTCLAGGGTWTKYNSSSACTTAGGTWQVPAAGCSVVGRCNDPAMTTAATCTGTVASGDLTGLVRQWKAATDLFRCEAAGGHWTGSKTNRGQIITSLCMTCHRQEASGAPMDATNPATALKVGPYHSSIGFPSHPHSNQFLNSPHGQYTGTFAQVATAKYGSGYGSYFQFMGEAANTGNGCTGCHNVHKSNVKGVGSEGHEACTECHSKDLNRMAHPQGVGTPLEHMATEPTEACTTCHMPAGEHLFRINTSASYSTYPAAARTANVNANTSPDGSYTNAVWVDLDSACGQCHGGGTAQATTTGATTSGSAVLTVASTAGFVVGQRVAVEGAGGLEADGVTREAQESYVLTVDSATQLTLVGKMSATLASTTITQNPTANGGAYITKAQLAQYAEGIHQDKPTVSFSTKLGAAPDTLTIYVDASASICAGTCEAYDWDWGDGSAHGSGATASHTYATGGSKSITLTVEEYGVNEASLTKTVTVYAPDVPPTVAGVCSFNADTWTMTVTDTSSDDKNGGLPKQVTVNWGDGTMLSNDLSAPFGPFTHTFLKAGTFTVTHKAIDTIGQASVVTCAPSPAPAYFTISGTVKNTLGTANLPSAIVKLKKSGVVVKTVYSSATGTFSAGSLKPGTYTLEVTKSGYTFAVPAATITVGPSSVGNIINSTAP